MYRQLPCKAGKCLKDYLYVGLYMYMYMYIMNHQAPILKLVSYVVHDLGKAITYIHVHVPVKTCVRFS